jgi:hypothetical protein
MKIKSIAFLPLAGLAVLLAGCINTVTDTKTAAVPWFNTDRVAARYERPADVVYGAAKDVLTHDGAMESAGSLYNQTNAVQVLSGKIQQDNVWIRVEAVEPHLTALTVQTRTAHGLADRDLAIEIDKEIALELATR